jgi:signal peptidase I
MGRLQKLVAMNCSYEEALAVHGLRLWKGTGKRISMRVETGSMVPLIRPGDVVEIAMVSADRVRTGDIVAYLQHGRVVVHRLIIQDRSAHGHRFWQRGDNLTGWGYFYEGDFLGSVETIHRGASVLNMDRDPWRLLNRVRGLSGLLKMVVVGGAHRIKRRVFRIL